MKYKNEVRQFKALERLFDDIEGYRELLRKPPKTLKAKKVMLIGKDVEKHLIGKLSKAEKCVANLEAKGIAARAG